MSDAVAPNPVGWFEIYVDDLDRAVAFYETTFGVTLESLDAPDTGGPPLAMKTFPMSMKGRGAAGALVKMEGVGPGPGGTLIYFSCEDCAVEAARAADAGGAIQQEKMAIGPYGHIAVVKDTEGNLIGLHSQQ
ncbi:VOC family protein [Alienimonas californiensis]|uniref:Glyoxalase-like domain protein n=1 Tax=Alienimonas californiensis TaxID=2527989 RepID=A0A517P6V8_9PLAN|nr:VOC family protein [Alienimonas californiensis]QDT15118.1 Glyoxalase-like domain protein [Alienimonas californiensis]